MPLRMLPVGRTPLPLQVHRRGSAPDLLVSFRSDIPDLQSLELKVMDHYLGTLTPARLAFIPHEALEELTRTCPRVAKVFRRDTLIDAAVFREWMLGMGRRSAVTRIAHVLCEVFVRLRAVGLAQERECELPLTQAELGDALGLSTVHVNRSLQEL